MNPFTPEALARIKARYTKSAKRAHKKRVANAKRLGYRLAHGKHFKPQFPSHINPTARGILAVWRANKSTS